MQSNVFRHPEERTLVDKLHQELVDRICISSFLDQLILQFYQSQDDDSDLVICESVFRL